ncbi:MAG TPA: hybrid sensor histidine kinase/response regulator [Flavobacteriales bacterium]|nr:hybrid sensor histidine kinase/response regulator [Flavobacteriales bacterium]
MGYESITILLVEDNPGDSRLINELLKETEYRTARLHTAHTLKEALDAQLPHASVACALLDLTLPDSEGIHTLIRLRRVYPDTAIVVLTGMDDEDMALGAMREGAQSYLTKAELDVSILYRTLRYSIERHGFIRRLREEEQRNAHLRVNERGIKAALEQEQSMNALKSRFVSLVSHEFRTPLAIIQGSVDLIDRYATGPEMEKVRSQATRIHAKVRELTALLGHVLDVESLDQHMATCSPKEFDIVALGEQVLADMQPLARTGQRLIHEVTGEERTVLLDHEMVVRVLTNLLSNAIKYSPEHSTITLDTRLDPRSIHLSVRNEGPGISEEDQGQLFERFYRGRNVGTSQGTGLGLNIVQRFVSIMGGEISFSSVPGNTVFEVHLPR